MDEIRIVERLDRRKAIMSCVSGLLDTRVCKCVEVKVEGPEEGWAFLWFLAGVVNRESVFDLVADMKSP